MQFDLGFNIRQHYVDANGCRLLYCWRVAAKQIGGGRKNTLVKN
jgi:hypothetical protein